MLLAVVAAVLAISAPIVSLSSPAPRSTVIFVLFVLAARLARVRVASSSPAPREIVESFTIVPVTLRVSLPAPRVALPIVPPATVRTFLPPPRLALVTVAPAFTVTLSAPAPAVRVATVPFTVTLFLKLFS